MTREEIDLMIKEDIKNAKVVRLTYNNGKVIKEKVYDSNNKCIINRSFK